MVKQQWDEWLKKSAEIVRELARLYQAGDPGGRNALIDANSDVSLVYEASLPPHHESVGSQDKT